MILTCILVRGPKILRLQLFTLQRQSCLFPILALPNHPTPSSTHLRHLIMYKALVLKMHSLSHTSHAKYEEHEFAADAIPMCPEPDFVIPGDAGLVRCIMLNNRIHVRSGHFRRSSYHIPDTSSPCSNITDMPSIPQSPTPGHHRTRSTGTADGNVPTDAKDDYFSTRLQQSGTPASPDDSRTGNFGRTKRPVSNTPSTTPTVVAEAPA